MQVFREGKRDIDVPARLRALGEATTRGDALDALLRAGELECALADLGDDATAEIAAWTDAAADALVRGERMGTRPVPEPRARIARASVPEGFAYYALHPLDYADAARRAAPEARHALVLGVRTIGTTLSAVAAAALRARGVIASRHTTRPFGHPFDRQARLDPRTAEDARRIAALGGIALVADEGPGLSGSSFLAAADALVDAGIPREHIVLLPSHAPDVNRLRAPRAAARWRALRTVVARPLHATPSCARGELSGGAWRAQLGPAAWPASWPAMERRKYLGDDGAVLKFEGLGHFGEASHARGARLYELGVGPRAHRIEHGFVRWERAPGRPIGTDDAPPLDALSRAIAARLELSEVPSVDVAALEAATRENVRLLGDRAVEISLPVARPAIVDGRLAPHEWIAASDGLISKVDAVSHGDDHFFPGPCDIAWDLAGAVVEWGLDDAHRDALVDGYVRRSGDHDARARLPAWTVAYAAFRAAWLSMARDACEGEEAARLASAAERARGALMRALAC